MNFKHQITPNNTAALGKTKEKENKKLATAKTLMNLRYT